MSSYFVCFACCLPVRGHTRSILCDVQQGTFLFIPNVLVDILEMSRERTVDDIKAHYGHEHDARIDEYLAFLVEKNQGFFTQTPQRFPPLDLDWRNPRLVTNCLVDFDTASTHDLVDLNQQLSQLACESLELRFFHPLSLETLTQHLDAFRDSTLRSISVVVGHHPSLQLEALEVLLVLHKRVKHLTIHSCPERDEHHHIDLSTDLIYTTEAVTSEACCGNVSSQLFRCNILSFTEARSFNSCLNRKVGIDTRGRIKNCPSMRRSFGDTRSTRLASVVGHEDFQRAWKTTKDQVLVCQDCEFRYICQDCRAYLQDPEQPLSKPARCRYNPYEARWE
ncbi:grasp-with-spasm system SPASM domain peptide maturase [Myxococcus stipitatus]|uniref:grasp-with-spasm system SPASM domain peptide maturase n=1 Tax=Myxococcus stipitatus TaxID=83455 RepID=UPI0030CA7DF6